MRKLYEKRPAPSFWQIGDDEDLLGYGEWPDDLQVELE
jgi:hypothetical protein